MERNLQTFIQHYLDNRETSLPIPTGWSPDLQGVSGIKAILFDIYGTLLVSASGDVDILTLREQYTLEATEQTGITFLTPEKTETAALMETLLIEKIRHIHREKKQKGISFPEVNIIDVWKDVFSSPGLTHRIQVPESFHTREFALIFEVFHNPVSPMPGMKSVLTLLAGKNIPMGIISNAQFYTPLLVSYFLTGTFTEESVVPLFHRDYLFFSYEHLRAKPDQFLFELARERLVRDNIRPGEILYLGNDMLNDILPASRAGFRTVLFAGDERSLRLRTEHPEVRGIKPDAVITDLAQLLTILNTGDNQ
jgi:putative hydrolase of the HAD superfamily